MIADLPDDAPVEAIREISELDTESDVEMEAEGLSLRAGTRLLAADCRVLREAEETHVISILAPKDAGKTSLIAGFYEIFLEGTADGFSFAGSDSLFSFENLCHLSRAASNRTQNDMLRTRRAEGLGFFHLRVDHGDRRVGLLLGDRPGETVREAAQGIGVASTLQELKSSDAIVYLIDGALLSNLETRHLPLSDAEAILETLSAAGVLNHRPSLALVLTKADVVETAGGGAQFEDIVQSLKDRFGDRFAVVESFRTAANADSTDAALPRGHGLNVLMVFLLGLKRPLASGGAACIEPGRQYSRFGRRGGAI
jgi:hypothetical protein